MDLMDIPPDLFWGEFKLDPSDRERLAEMIARADALAEELRELIMYVYRKWKQLENPPEP